MNSNFFITLHQRLKSSAKNVFLELHDGSTMTYEEADKQSAQLANRLTSLGIGAGERVTAQIEKSPQSVLLYLACLRAGVIFHPLNTAYTLHELEYFLNDAQPSLLVVDPSRFAEADRLAKSAQINHVLSLDENGTGSFLQNIETEKDEFGVSERQEDDTALLIYTSGTTGKPKGAMITHRNLSFNSNSMVDVWRWHPSDVLLHSLPLFHIHGLCFALLCPMMEGCRILLQPKFSVNETVRLIPRATVMMGVPTMYTRLLNHPRFDRDLCKDMRLFISGSAPLKPETFNAFEYTTGHRIVERYGMSEAQIISSNPVDGDRIEGSVGEALPGVSLRVSDACGNRIETGEAGTLEVKGPNVFKGYWRNPKASSSSFRDDGYFITGDIATVDQHGIVTIVGRLSDMIVSAGFNIYPKEIEVEINRIEGIRDSAVFSAPHADLGEGVVAAVVTSDENLNEQSIVTVLRQKLSAFKLPKRIVFLEELPRNAMGKVEKTVLRKRFSETFEKTKD